MSLCLSPSLFREKELTDKLEQFKIVLKKLPSENYNNLRYIALSDLDQWRLLRGGLLIIMYGTERMKLQQTMCLMYLIPFYSIRLQRLP
jgi:hypothetical protein